MPRSSPRPQLLPINVPPRAVTEAHQDDLPSEETMRMLDLDERQFGDFIRAFKFVIYRTAGDNVREAAARAGIARSSIYEEYWASLTTKAQRLVIGRLSGNITAATNSVFDQWPEMVERLVADVLNPITATRDRVAAMEFLFMAVISPAKDERPDDSQERTYLQNGGNFNPMTALQGIEGATINVHIHPAEAKPSHDYIDIEPTDD